MAETPSGGRLPDFLLIGAMKSGTTTLFRWLGEHPDVWTSSIKEPQFFSKEDGWANGFDWYRSFFAGAPAGAMLGEASGSSTDLVHAPVAAERIAAAVPDARLIYLVREPVARLRSHYRFSVMKGWEHCSLPEALADHGSELVTTGLYHTCLRPYLDRFPRQHVLVVPMDDLAPPDHTGWFEVLDHLGLAPIEPPGRVYYRTSGLQRPSWFGRALAAVHVTNRPPWAPRWLADVGRRAYFYNRQRDRRLASADAPIPDEIVTRLHDDADRLAEALGRPPFWPRPTHS